MQEQQKTFQASVLSRLEKIENCLVVWEDGVAEREHEGDETLRSREPLRSVAQYIAFHAVQSLIKEVARGGSGMWFAVYVNPSLIFRSSSQSAGCTDGHGDQHFSQPETTNVSSLVVVRHYETLPLCGAGLMFYHLHSVYLGVYLGA